MFRWLTRLFPKHAEAEGRSDAPSAVALLPPLPEVAPEEIRPVPAAPETARAAAPVDDEPTSIMEPVEAAPQKETCPDCGKTSVFAGPPEHRYCMHCALRQELFGASAATGH